MQPSQREQHEAGHILATAIWASIAELIAAFGGGAKARRSAAQLELLAVECDDMKAGSFAAGFLRGAAHAMSKHRIAAVPRSKQDR
jgi:hypothetical protein